MIAAQDNPFATRHLLKIKYLISPGEWMALCDLLKQNNYYGAIVGPCGTGKTTLLENLFEFLQQKQILVQYHSTESQKFNCYSILKSLRHTQITIIDGWDHLSLISQKLIKIFSIYLKRGLIVSVHGKCDLPTIFETKCEISLFLQIVDQLSSRVVVDTARIQAQSLSCYLAAQGNMREAFLALYDYCATQMTKGDLSDNLTSG